jgi:hypothetical protein
MKFTRFLTFGILCFIFLSFISPPWGFYAHKVINRMAVFILPPEMMSFYKKHIDFLAEHAPDPDKRRYAVPGEAIKHYMDIDHWGEAPFTRLPRKWEDALAQFIQIRAVGPNDTLLLKSDTLIPYGSDTLRLNGFLVDKRRFSNFIYDPVKRTFGREDWIFPTDSLNSWLGIAVDTSLYPIVHCTEDFSRHGINPWYIRIHFDRLVKAFQRQDVAAILRLSADLGHYIADSHVPLHATKNYNGQLTGQEGIHAFWESRLPELFAEAEYDYFVGKARYIRDVQSFAWETVIESNRLSYIVLEEEAKLSETYRKDRQYGYDIRLNRTVRTQTREYATAFHKKMRGMVEKRMQDAVLALGSLWFTAWVDAGQPSLGEVPDLRWNPEDILNMEKLENDFRLGEPIGRDCK